MTAFLIGLGIGAGWMIAGVGVAIWFHKSVANKFQYGDETGTEFPEPRKPV